MIHEESDVIIVGGGPAGSMAGYFLAQYGISCVILDKASFPRDKPCGGGISGKCVKEYPLLLSFLDFPSYRVIIGTEDVGTPGEVYEETEAFSYNVRRIDFDAKLLAQARQQGVLVRENTRVVAIRENQNGVVVQTHKGEEFRARFVIGADGVNSVTRKQVGLEKYWNRERVAHALVSILDAPSGIARQFQTERHNSHAHVGFGHRMGYSWVFPNADGFNVGFGALLPKNKLPDLYAYFHDYVAACQKAVLIPEGDLPPPKMWPIPFDGGMRKFATTRVLLIGDAAGFCQALSGEGIQYAIQSAEIAAHCIAHHLKDQAMPAERVGKEYRQRVRRSFGQDLKSAARKIALMEKLGVTPSEIIRTDQKIGPLMQRFIMGRATYQQLKWKMLARGAIAILRVKWRNWRKRPAGNAQIEVSKAF